MTAPATSPLLIYLGELFSLNGTPTFAQAANFLDGFDQVVVKVPSAQIEGASPGIINPLGTTPDFFSTISQCLNPVWIYLKCSDNDANTEAALTRIRNASTTLYSWFKKYDLLDKLAGFYLDRFGFDTNFNSGWMTRLTQIQIVQIFHGSLQLPVMVNATDPADIFSPIGKNLERGDTVMPSIIGSDPTYVDFVHINNPLISAWTGVTPTYDPTKIAHMIGLLKSFAVNRYLTLYTTQGFALDNAAIDNLLGITLDSPTQTILTDVHRFLRCLGFFNLGMVEKGNSLTVPKALDNQYLDFTWSTTDNAGSDYGELFSKSGSYYIKNTVNDNGAISQKIHQFNSSFSYIASV